MGLTAVWAPVAAADHRPGDLDLSFGGGDGVALADFSADDDIFDAAFGLAVRPGMLVAAGRSGAGGGNFALAGYGSDGAPASIFGGGNGRVATGFGGYEQANAVAITPGLGIYAAGQANAEGGTSTEGSSFALARYFNTGDLNIAFDGDGKVTTDFADGAVANAIAFDPGVDDSDPGDDRVVAAGTRFQDFGGVFDDDFAVARYEPDGSLDTSFDGDGRAVADFGGLDQANAVAIDSEHRIVAAGTPGVDGFALVRFDVDGSLDSNPDGTPDRGFGTAGWAVTNLTAVVGADEEASAVAIQPDGGIVAAGAAAIGGERFVLARYHADGLDTTPPETTIDSGPSVTTSDPTPVFGFSSSGPGSSFSCSLDSTDFLACSSPHALDPLPDGSYEFFVEARDAAGNTDSAPAVRSFRIDMTSPPQGGPAPSGIRSASRVGADTAVTIRIERGRVQLRGHRAAVTLACPANEASPPCAGRLVLKTARGFRFHGKRRRVVLAARHFSLGVGRARLVRLVLSGGKARLVRAERKARRVRAIARVRDRAGDWARVASRIGLRVQDGKAGRSHAARPEVRRRQR